MHVQGTNHFLPVKSEDNYIVKKEKETCGIKTTQVSNCVNLLGKLSDWSSVNAHASYHCDQGSIPGIAMWDGHVVTKSDRWVSSGQSGFPPHEDHPNAIIGANEHD